VPNPGAQPLEVILDAVFDSWDRNNRILVNLLRAIPEGGFEATAVPGSKSVAEMFLHMNYVRLIFLVEDAPEFALTPPPREWLRNSRQQIGTGPVDTARLAADFNLSAIAVRDAVKGRIDTGRPMDLHYDHPLLFLEHMIWHEGYHHGQIKLALKAAGQPFDDEQIGAITWDVWMDKAIVSLE